MSAVKASDNVEVTVNSNYEKNASSFIYLNRKLLTKIDLKLSITLISAGI